MTSKAVADVATVVAALLAAVATAAWIGSALDLEPGVEGGVTVAIGGACVLLLGRDGQRRVAAGRPARWNALAAAGAGRECTVWFAVICVEMTMLIGVTGAFTEPWASGAIVGAFFGALVAIWVGAQRHWHPVAVPAQATRTPTRR